MKQNSKRLTSIVIAGLFLLFAVVVYIEFIIPAYTTLQQDKGQAQSEQALYTNEKQVVSQVNSLIATYQGEASSTQSVNMALPVGQNVAGALAQIYGIAANTGFELQGTGVDVQAVQVTAASTPSIGSAAATGGSIVSPVGTISLQVSGTGSYESFISFLQGLENNIRLFDVTSVSLQQANNAGTKGSTDFFTYKLTVVTYYQSS